MSATVAASTKPGLRSYAIWALQVLLALLFVAAATAKLLGVPMMVKTFELIGFGQWFRYVTAAVEIIGGIGMLVPGFAGPAAVWLGLTMVCATAAHVLVLPDPPGGAIVLLVMLLAGCATHRVDWASDILRCRPGHPCRCAGSHELWTGWHRDFPL